MGKKKLLTILILLHVVSLPRIFAKTSSTLFYENFATSANFSTNWSVLDKNSDANTWTYSATLLSPDNVNKGGVICNTPSSVVNNDYLIMKNPVAMSVGDHNLSFYFKARSKTRYENMRILYGTSSDPSQMKDTIFVSTDFNFSAWTFKYSNFNVKESGNYYFAFEVYSKANQSGVCLDEITLSEGQYVGTPDLTMKSITMPPSSCELGLNNPITYTVSNVGTASLNGFDLICKVNGTQTKTISYADVIEAGNSKTYTVNNVTDFSPEGIYKVTLIGSNSADLNHANDSIVGNVSHLQPLPNDSLPRDFVFKSTGKIHASEWFPYKSNSWVLNSYGWHVNSGVDSSALVSRCFNLIPNTYRITFTYKAGWTDNISQITNSFKILYGKAGTDISTWATLKDFNDIYTSAYTQAMAIVKITSGDTYSFAFIPSSDLTYQRLEITNVTISTNPDYDIRVSSSTMKPRYTQIPVEHLSASSSITATIENTGNADVTNAGLTIYGKNGLVEAASERASLQSTKSNTFNFTIPIVGYSAGDQAQLSLKAEMDQTDAYSVDNSYNYNFAVTDSVMSIDNVTTITDEGMGGTIPANLGSIFTIAKADTLTSVTIGWGVRSKAANTAIKLALYSIDRSTDRVVKKFYEIDANRSATSSYVNYTLPARYLYPGEYYLEIQQLDSTYIGIATDWVNGEICQRDKYNNLTYISHYGQLAIRPNFGHNSIVMRYDVSVKSINKPNVGYGLFAVNEPIVATIENKNAEYIQNLPVVCDIDGVKTTCIVDHIDPYSTATATFERDLSATGTRNIKIYTQLVADQVHANDTLQVNVLSKAALDPYKFDFEESETFSYSNFNPNWKSVDVDQSTTVPFDVTFNHYNEPLGFIIYNPAELTPPKTTDNMKAYQGNKYGVSMRTNSGISNDWLISPKLNLGTNAKLSFYAKSMSSKFNLEKFNILVSTTDDNLASFTNLTSTTYEAPAMNWTNYNFDLSSYNNQSVYLAIQCVSNNALVFMIDDINVDAGLSSINNSNGDEVKVFPTIVKDAIQIYSSFPVNQISIANMEGKVVNNSTLFSPATSLKVNVENLPNGIYLATIKTTNGSKIVKFVVAK